MHKFYAQALISVFETKDENGNIKISGVVSTPKVDRHDDTVELSALEKSIAGYMQNPVLLLQHNDNHVIGNTINMSVNYDKQQIEFEGIVINDIDGVKEKIRNGTLKGVSIGFMLKAYDWIQSEEKTIRRISELELLEISLVSIPANPDALFTMAKSIKSMFQKITTKGENSQPVEVAPGEIVEVPTELPSEVLPAEESEGKSQEVVEGNSLENTEEGNAPEEPVEGKAPDRLDTLEQTVNSLVSQVSELSEAKAKALEVEAKALETERELKELKSKLSKTELSTAHKSQYTIKGIDKNGYLII